MVMLHCSLFPRLVSGLRLFFLGRRSQRMLIMSLAAPAGVTVARELANATGVVEAEALRRWEILLDIS